MLPERSVRLRVRPRQSLDQYQAESALVGHVLAVHVGCSSGPFRRVGNVDHENAAGRQAGDLEVQSSVTRPSRGSSPYVISSSCKHAPVAPKAGRCSRGVDSARDGALPRHDQHVSTSSPDCHAGLPELAVAVDVPRAWPLPCRAGPSRSTGTFRLARHAVADSRHILTGCDRRGWPSACPPAALRLRIRPEMRAAVSCRQQKDVRGLGADLTATRSAHSFRCAGEIFGRKPLDVAEVCRPSSSSCHASAASPKN